MFDKDENLYGNQQNFLSYFPIKENYEYIDKNLTRFNLKDSKSINEFQNKDSENSNTANNFISSNTTKQN